MPEPAPPASHETTDVNSRGILWFGLGLALCTALIAGVICWMVAELDHSGLHWPHRSVNVPPQFQSPPPTLQVDSAVELQEFREQEDKILQSHGWVDRKAGIVRIPVERAMEILAQKGLPQTSTRMPLPGPKQPPAAVPEPPHPNSP